MNEQEDKALESLKKMLDMTTSIVASAGGAFEAMILTKTPCNTEIMQLGMLLHAATSFSVALKNWIELCEEQQATIVDIGINKGS